MMKVVRAERKDSNVQISFFLFGVNKTNYFARLVKHLFEILCKLRLFILPGYL